MNEQRQQAYLNLIQSLLNCRSDDEVQEILAANQDLIDAGLVQKMLEIARNLLRQGELDQANGLMNIAGQQLGVYSKLSSTATKKEWLDFLEQALKVTADSIGKVQVVYPILRANIKKLNSISATVFRDWAENKLRQVQLDEGKGIASDIVDLSKLIQEFPLGDKPNNIEIAIAGYKVALNVFNSNIFTLQWAMVQNNLGIAYCQRILGDKVENQEYAIQSFKSSLKIITRSKFPQEWAITQSNLGNAYFYRVKGNRVENVECAVKAYTAALEVITRSTLPSEWAMVQNNLGNAYLERQGKDKENIENAIIAYTAALEIYTRFEFPQEWAITQNNLGNAYLDRVKLDRDQVYRNENIENAITIFSAALEVFSRTDFPEQWAMIQNNLGKAYRQRILGDRVENLEKAIEFCTSALEVFTHTSFPQNHASTLSNIGIIYQEAQQLTEAYTTFNSAITIVESLRGEIISGDESKRKQAEEWNKLYRHIVEVCLELGNIIKAIEYVERSKNRNLVEQILARDLKTIFPPDVVTQIEQYKDEIAVGQYQIQNGKAENPKVLAQHLQELRQQRNELQDRYLPVGSGFNFDSFQATLNEHTAIIEWYILNDNILTFIVIKQGEVTVWQSQPEDLQALVNWINQYLQNYYEQKDQWLNSLGEALKELASILHIDEILTQIPKHCDKLILIPHRFLHLFPLHAIPINQNSENSSYLLDLFAGGVSYAPSCQLLQQVQQRQRPDFQSLFAIQNPTEDLNYTNLEVQVIQRYFNTSNVLKKTAATLTAINNTDLNTYHCAHFSCHGYFNLINPGNSALILANAPVADTLSQPNTERYLNLRTGETHDLDKCLTLDKIFSLKLQKCRLVTLSACETGLIDYKNTSDEYIGLPSGFLLAGSKAVVSSLWTVSDLSTAFLMMKFYENLQTITSVSIALNQAQQWLRNLTTEEFEALLVKYHPQIEEIFAQLPEEKRPLARAILKRTCKQKPHPFAAPFYWAGFTATGL
ncbi:MULTISPECIES: CHAT domain-containing tetratricopeptide repeat protein [unclassified Nostoc]|uniref:CHAT domain-containing protein n=1 Tax=unclassified Nostoc TaxID=2593658 RepID=UPI002AD3785E|nr:CHAT domain-containing tetratricopeptide repeat protein [Nostoc sp. DedQUE03]MDZ7972646.1 CHAT domain-containing tetratricopeptide repeat protein [Nostoc sp. DedQUE03]MDZ8046008.1 CHAT domain-containing tetratricopeptide repeat protein [Nostoc sp. DedQUE02]